jgi:large subunit ribosomal protein L30e
MSIDKDIKKALKEKKTLLGSRSVIQAARNGKIESLVYARNTPQSTITDIRHYANVSGIKVQEFPGNSIELGELCGKPFSILLLGITK